MSASARTLTLDLPPWLGVEIAGRTGGNGSAQGVDVKIEVSLTILGGLYAQTIYRLMRFFGFHCIFIV